MKVCKICNKSIGNLGFKCHYCDGDFCVDHRIPELHNCLGNPPNLNLDRDKLYNKPKLIDVIIEEMLNDDEKSKSETKLKIKSKLTTNQNKKFEQIKQNFGNLYHFKCKICKNPVSLFYLICSNCFQLYCAHCGHINMDFPYKCQNCGRDPDNLYDPIALEINSEIKDISDMKKWIEKKFNTTIIECNQCSSKFLSIWELCPFCGKKKE